MTLVINHRSPICLGSFQGNLGDLAPQFHKYLPLNKAYDILPLQAIELLDVTVRFAKHQHAHILVDFKVRDLDVGDCGCPLTGWHLDCTSNPNHQSKPDNHMILSTDFGTEFVDEPVVVDSHITHFKELIRPDFRIFKAEPNKIYQYSRDLHRGPIITQKCRRVVMRLTETDII